MKINKTSGNSVIAASNIDSVADGKAAAIEHIKSAINILGTKSKEDTVAKEAIADLSVILLDLNN